MRSNRGIPLRVQHGQDDALSITTADFPFHSLFMCDVGQKKDKHRWVRTLYDKHHEKATPFSRA
jgi:hypothetical protein